MSTVKSLEFDQSIILQSILTLCKLDRFQADISYGNGQFYKKNIEVPEYIFDKDGTLPNVTEACSTDLPLGTGSLDSLVFDPPFLTYVRSAREGNGSMVMAKRFSGYWRYDELELHYRDTLKEASRVLMKKGIMVFKCQDIIHNHKMHCTHVNIINWAAEFGFRLKDLFVLGAKHRMPSPNRKGVQKHARVYHSYFLVLEKL